MGEQTLADLVHAPRSRGVPVPDIGRLMTGRVWPVDEGWVGEVGDGVTPHIVGGLLDSMQEAVDAVEMAICEGRTDAARFAALLAAPQIKVHHYQDQAKPQLMTLPA